MGTTASRMIPWRVPALLWLASLLSACATPAPPVSLLNERDLPRYVAPSSVNPPRVALVLSGGSARGFAHLGEVSLRIRIDGFSFPVPEIGNNSSRSCRKAGEYRCPANTIVSWHEYLSRRGLNFWSLFQSTWMRSFWSVQLPLQFRSSTTAWYSRPSSLSLPCSCPF